jgi:hypothetical protein
MAAKKNVNNHAKRKALPKGFVEARQRLDGFFERAEGNAVTGILRGSFQVKGKFGPKNVYRIEITDGETQVGDGEVVGVGATVGVDESGYTRVLGELEPGCQVFIRYEGRDGEGDKASHIYSIGKAE